MATIRPTIISLDATRLLRGTELAFQYSTRAPAEICNYTGKEVVFEAYAATPHVDIPTIDAELNVVVVPVIGKRGKVIKRKAYAGASSAPGQAPFAALIVQARANPSSKYNLLTNLRYALTASPFKGVSREAGRAAMAALVDKMIKSRHRSVNFIRAGWVKAMRVLKSLAPSKYGGTVRGGALSNANDDLGDVTPAVAGRFQTTCVIENDVGMAGQNAASNNRALQQYGAPGLQYAMDKVGKAAMERYLKRSGEAELYGPVNAAWK